MTATMPFVHRWSLALATDARLSAVDLAVGRALALHMSPDGRSCWPTHRRIAFEVHVSPRTVRRSVATLLRRGWLVQVGHSAPGRAVEYRAQVPDIPAPERLSFEPEQRPREATVQRPREAGVPPEQRPLTTITPVTGGRPGGHQVANTDTRAHIVALTDKLARDFDEVWRAYPRRIAKAAAMRAYLARRRAGVAHADLLSATLNYADATVGTPERFVMHAATFFGPDERWREFLEPRNESEVVYT